MSISEKIADIAEVNPNIMRVIMEHSSWAGPTPPAVASQTDDILRALAFAAAYSDRTSRRHKNYVQAASRFQPHMVTAPKFQAWYWLAREHALRNKAVSGVSTPEQLSAEAAEIIRARKAARERHPAMERTEKKWQHVLDSAPSNNVTDVISEIIVESGGAPEPPTQLFVARPPPEARSAPGPVTADMTDFADVLVDAPVYDADPVVDAAGVAPEVSGRGYLPILAVGAAVIMWSMFRRTGGA